MTALTATIAVIGVVICLAVWWGYHWLAQRMDADDRKDKGDMG